MGQSAQYVLGLCYFHGLFFRIPAYLCPATLSVQCALLHMYYVKCMAGGLYNYIVYLAIVGSMLRPVITFTVHLETKLASIALTAHSIDW